MRNWREFVNQWPAVTLTRLAVPERTVHAWRSGIAEPVGWQREAAEFWLERHAGPVGVRPARARKVAGKRGS